MIRWFALHPTASNILMLAIIILGLVSLPDLRRETFPALQNDKIEVRILYKGATASEVEDALCRRLETAYESISDLDELRCEAREGMGVATVVMREGADLSRFLNDVKAETDSINDFPDEIEPPVITEIGRTDAVVSIAITGAKDPVVLKAYAEDVKSRLQTLDTIATATITGFSAHQIQIEIPAWRFTAIWFIHHGYC